MASLQTLRLVSSGLKGWICLIIRKSRVQSICCLCASLSVKHSFKSELGNDPFTTNGTGKKNWILQKTKAGRTTHIPLINITFWHLWSHFDDILSPSYYIAEQSQKMSTSKHNRKNNTGYFLLVSQGLLGVMVKRNCLL